MRFSPPILLHALLFVALTPSALASHFRYATISWKQLFGTTIEVRIDQAWRRDFGYYYDPANCGAGGCAVGSTTHTGTMQMTGASYETAEVYLEVTAVNADQNYFLGTFNTYATYSNSGPHQLSFYICCRLAGILNSPEEVPTTSTVRILSGRDQSSPVMSVPPIVRFEQGRPHGFMIPARDPDLDVLHFSRVAVGDGSGGINGLSVNPLTGQLTWQPSVATPKGLYVVVLKVQDYDKRYCSAPVTACSSAHILSDVMVDFFVEVTEKTGFCSPTCANAGNVCTASTEEVDCGACDTSGAFPHKCTDNTAPVFMAPTPADGSTVTGNQGSTVTFNVRAGDNFSFDTVRFQPSWTTPGMQFINEATPSPGVRTATFQWAIPASAGQINQACFTAIDDKEAESPLHCINVNVGGPVVTAVTRASDGATVGWNDGGELLNVAGSNFGGGGVGDYKCRFLEPDGLGALAIVPATYQSPTLITCTTPALTPRSGPFRVEIAKDGSGYTDSHGIFSMGFPCPPSKENPCSGAGICLQTGQCDCNQGWFGPACSHDESCGDGIRGGLACDDGNLLSGDGCSSTCQIEYMWACNDASPSVCQRCGNGVREGNETCDDGNFVTGDGCTSACILENGWGCDLATPNVCERCGNGILEGTERGLSRCDDGNIANGDGCSSTCDREVGWTCNQASPTVCQQCGNGVREGTEECDDGNIVGDPKDGCSATCFVEDGWNCNNMVIPSTCANTPALCGNSAIDGAEQCDDGNKVTGDGCSYGACAIEPGWTCGAAVPNVCQKCGNGIREGTETCDDGNTASNDGCSATCALESGWTCNDPASPAEYPDLCSKCGNGRREGAESIEGRCDDGNITPGDGCSNGCVVEAGWTCSGFVTSTCSLCGNGIREGAEACDDAGVVAGDGCSPTCTVESGWSCFDPAGSPADPDVCVLCGDGVRDLNEMCDDGNIVSGDGCSSSCVIEEGWNCVDPPTPSSAPDSCHLCGNGEVEHPENCDDGNAASGDGCSSLCALESGWTCHDPPTPPSAPDVCQSCGNGIREGSETCDDANTNAGDGCSDLCAIENGWTCDHDASMSGAAGDTCQRCGDGVPQGNEGCDDGNEADGDGCSATCRVEDGFTCSDDSPSRCGRCGNLIQESSEECDDGNILDGDGCSRLCRLELGWTCSGAPFPGNRVCRRASDGDAGQYALGSSAVTAGDTHTCARIAGRVLCWGRGDLGQLGTGNTTDLGALPAEVERIRGIPLAASTAGADVRVTQVSSGWDHTCAIVQTSGAVLCWGAGAHGRLGYGAETNIGDAPGQIPALTPVNFQPGSQIAVQVSSGAEHTCALFVHGGIRCWGTGLHGRLGTGSVTDVGFLAGQMEALRDISFAFSNPAVQVAAGRAHTCAFFHLRGIVCWGLALQGQLGTDATVDLGNKPGDMESLGPIQFSITDNSTAPVQVAAGGSHSCALFSNGEVLCWGSGMYGQLGTGSPGEVGRVVGEMQSLRPIVFSSSEQAVQVTTGERHTCALFRTGHTRCWGNGASGQLGYSTTSDVGNTQNSMTALGYVDLGPEAVVIQITAGRDHTCAVLSTGQMRCWGAGGSGRLGLGDQVDVANPASVPFVPVVLVAVTELVPGALPRYTAGKITIIGVGFTAAVESFWEVLFAPQPPCSEPAANFTGSALSAIPGGFIVDAPGWGCPPGSSATVTVSRDGMQSAVDSTRENTIVFFDPPVVLAVSPALGQSSGSTHVLFTGTNIVNTFVARCRFGTGHAAPSVPATAMPGLVGGLVCVSPPHTPASVEVALALDGVTFAAQQTSVLFTFHDASIANISVVRGPALGGSEVSLFLDGNPSVLSMLIGGAAVVRLQAASGWDVSVAARTVREDRAPGGAAVRFITPRVPRGQNGLALPAELQVSVSVNDENEFLPNSVPFEYFAEPAIFAVEPIAIPGLAADDAALITLYGSNFIGRPGCKLYFVKAGEVTLEADAVLDTELHRFIVTIPRSSRPVGKHQLSLSFNDGVDRSPPALDFSFFQVLSVTPTLGPARGGTHIQVVGAGFVSSSQWVCNFGSSHVPALYLSTTTMSCASPATNATLSRLLSLSIDGMHYSAAVGYMYYYPPIVTRISPASGPTMQQVSPGRVDNNSSLTIHGTGFSMAKAGVAQCKVGAEILTSIQVRDDAVECPMPHGIGVLPVYLSLNGIEYDDTGRVFSFYDIFTVDPALGPSTGATTVVVSGSGFLSTTEWSCIFGSGSTPVVAEVIASGQLRCRTPPSSIGHGLTPVFVSGDGGSTFASSSSAVFMFYAAPRVTSVSPTSGPGGGGSEPQATVVTVFGSGFVAQGATPVLCRFGSTSTSLAQVLSSTTLICPSPPGGDGIVTLEVGLNGVDFTTDRVPFGFFSLSRIDPALGPDTGGTQVTVSGNGFLAEAFARGDAACRFGSVPATAIAFIDAVRVVCTAPSLAPPPEKEPQGMVAGPVQVSVTMNGVDYPLETPIFSPYATPTITAIHPSAGPAAGGTRVTIHGTGFFSTPLLGCRFGDAATLQAGNVTLSGPTASMTCTTGGSMLPGPTPLAVSLNGQRRDDVPSPVPFAVFSVDVMFPIRGPRTGGTAVVLSGRGFVTEAVTEASYGHRYSCAWRNPESQLQIVLLSPAIAVDAASVSCKSPADPPSSVSLTTDDGASVSVGPLASFGSYDAPRITSVTPSSGPSAGGFAVTVSGFGFLPVVSVLAAKDPTRRAASSGIGDAVMCGFFTTAGAVSPSSPEGSSSASVSIRDGATPALSVSDTSITCNVTAHARGTQIVAISLNGGVDYTAAPSSVTVTFRDCDPGFSAESSTDPCKACPAGTFKPLAGPGLCQPCDAVSFADAPASSNCTLCPANTAVFGADGSARSHCLCQRGFYHPLSVPGEPCVSCPGGGICDGQLAMPRADAGYWAPEDSPTVFLQCANPASCPGGAPGSCAEGHLGRLCAECEPGWYALSHRCRPCPDNAVWILVAVALVAMLLVVLFFRIVGKRIIAFAGVLRIATKFFQVVALLSRMDLRWPSSVADAMRYTTAVFWLDPDMLASECSLRMFTYEVKWALTLLLPVVFAFLFAVLYAVIRVATRSGTPATRSSLRNRIVNAYLLLLSLGYILLASTALELFGCTREKDGRYVLDVDKSKFCFDDWWWRMLPFASAAVVAYGLGIPLAFVLWFHSNRDRVDELQFTERFHSLYSAYRPKRVHWEGVAMAEKLLYATTARLLASDVLFQAIIFIVLLVASMSLHVSRQPFLRKTDNVLHVVLYWCAILLLCAGLMFESNRFSTLTAREVAAGIAVGIIATGVAAILFFVAREFVDIRRAEWKDIPEDLLKLIDDHMHATGRKLVRHWLRRTADKAFWERRLARVLRSIAAAGEVEGDACRDVPVADVASAEPHVSLYCSHVWFGVSLRLASVWCLRATRQRYSGEADTPVEDFRDVMAAIARYAYTSHGVTATVAKPEYTAETSRGQSSVFFSDAAFGDGGDTADPSEDEDGARAGVDTPAVRAMLALLYDGVGQSFARATGSPGASGDALVPARGSRWWQWMHRVFAETSGFVGKYDALGDAEFGDPVDLGDNGIELVDVSTSRPMNPNSDDGDIDIGGDDESDGGQDVVAGADGSTLVLTSPSVHHQKHHGREISPASTVPPSQLLSKPSSTPAPPPPPPPPPAPPLPVREKEAIPEKPDVPNAAVSSTTGTTAVDEPQVPEHCQGGEGKVHNDQNDQDPDRQRNSVKFSDDDDDDNDDNDDGESLLIVSRPESQRTDPDDDPGPANFDHARLAIDQSHGWKRVPPARANVPFGGRKSVAPVGKDKIKSLISLYDNNE